MEKEKFKIVYETQWVSSDKISGANGFIAPLVLFPKGADPDWCAEICRREMKFENDEFICIGASPKKMLLMTDIKWFPKNKKQFDKWKERN